jgi:small-conductance mechanosensitive channel
MFESLYPNLIKTLITFVILILITVAINASYLPKVDSRRQKKKFRIRSFYISFIFFILFMAKIWVDGFAQLFTFLALIAAALVITNKETIMNFVGWLIIMWRGLFSEEDLIQIQHYKGYVKSIGVLYFEITEVDAKYNTVFTGKIIKIPNGLLTSHPLTNYSQTSHLLEQHIQIIITPTSHIEKSEALFKNIIDTALINFYSNKKEYSLEYIKKRNKHLIHNINLNTVLTLKPHQIQPVGIEITARYYCFASDHEKIEQIIWHELFKNLQQNPDVMLSYHTN